jgi:hypothetical protein
VQQSHAELAHHCALLAVDEPPKDFALNGRRQDRNVLRPIQHPKDPDDRFEQVVRQVAHGNARRLGLGLSRRARLQRERGDCVGSSTRISASSSHANPLWGAPRIHGELLKLGIDVGQTSVAKYMARRRRPPSQGWKTFLRNHADGIASIDLFVVPTVSFHCCMAC